MIRKIISQKRSDTKLSEMLVDLQIKTRTLPPLSPVEKAKFEQNLAIDQLYYSSKVEGTALSKEMIDNAIHGKKFPMA